MLQQGQQKQPQLGKTKKKKKKKIESGKQRKKPNNEK
jgi:hypothetical protein